MTQPLRATPFRGDPDVDELHAFFQPERQYAGDARWTFGTSLKSAYVNSFEFLNHAPVVQLWRDGDGAVQAVSRIALGRGEWFHQVAPAYRNADVARAIVEQADAALQLLGARPGWRTVAYRSDVATAQLLGDCGYAEAGCDEVFMTRALDTGPRGAPGPSDASGIAIRVLDPDDAEQVGQRGDAQTDAFLDDQPVHEVAAWMRRTMVHQLAYGRPTRHPSVVAVDSGGTVLAFADFFCDPHNRIAEFEPVGTRKRRQRRGLAKAVLWHGLEMMREAGMQQAIVRTGADNAAAIAAYRSVGFAVEDHLMNYRKERSR